MTPGERHRLIGELFHAALQLEPSRRDEYVRQACSGDDTIRQEVESLLEANDRAGAFIEKPVELSNGFVTDVDADSLLGKQINQYKIIGVVGQGGMGVVYRAEDSRLIRTVTIKVLRNPSPDKPGSRNRLLREAQAAAALNHPNTFTVHEVGEAAEGGPCPRELLSW